MEEGPLYPSLCTNHFSLLNAPKLTMGELSLPSALFHRSTHPHSLPPRYRPTLGLPALQGAYAHTHRYPGVSHSQTFLSLPKLTGFPLGPSSPVGPLGPGGPASPACPASPFSPRSPRGPCSASGGNRGSQGSRESQGNSLLLRQPQPPLSHLVTTGQSGSGLWGVSWPFLPSRKWWLGSFRPRDQAGGGPRPRERKARVVKGKRYQGQGLRTATHLDTRLALDARRPRLSGLPLQREEHQSPPHILTTPHLCQK